MSKRKQTLNVTNALTSQEISNAEQLWLLSIQKSLPNTQNYKQLQLQLGLFVDDAGVIRSQGRLSHSNLPYTTKCPALLPRNHYLTQLIIKDCHKSANHCGVQDTLAELRCSIGLFEPINLSRLFWTGVGIVVNLKVNRLKGHWKRHSQNSESVKPLPLIKSVLITVAHC